MRGHMDKQGTMLMIFNLEDRVPADHPLRKVRLTADEELKRLSSVFIKTYSHTGRPSIPPERILKSMLLIAFCSVRSERQSFPFDMLDISSFPLLILKHRASREPLQEVTTRFDVHLRRSVFGRHRVHFVAISALMKLRAGNTRTLRTGERGDYFPSGGVGEKFEFSHDNLQDRGFGLGVSNTIVKTNKVA